MVIAHYEDDVVPAKNPHHLKPYERLMRVRRNRAQERQMYALEEEKEKDTASSTTVTRNIYIYGELMEKRIPYQNI